MAKEKRPTRDYSNEINTIPPEYLRTWAARGTRERELFLYKAGTHTDYMTGLSEKVAVCHCTACCADVKMTRVSGYVCNGHASEMGFLSEDGKKCRSWTQTKCPACEAEVTAMHIVGTARRYGEEYSYPLTLQRIDGGGERDRLALVLWQACCWYSWEGTRHEDIRFFEAYIAEEKRLLRVTAHISNMGSGQIFIPPKQVQRITETMKAVESVVVPDWGIIEGTTCENAKLEIYLKSTKKPIFPAAYLSLWQKRRGAETLLTCGAGNILNALIAEEKMQGASYKEIYNNKFTKLKTLDWTAKRPSDILRLHGRDELREAIRTDRLKIVPVRYWALLIEAREAGRGWKLEDMLAAKELNMSHLPDESEPRPERLRRYLHNQKRRHPEGNADLRYLRDYWNMREKLPEELRGPEWPENLTREHDLAVMRQEEKTHKKLEAGFRTREKELNRLCFEADGILIRPPKNEAELIKEGKSLEHCVATYAERHASGVTAILFVRRADDPEIPWYTLNLDEANLSVIQNRGRRNCIRTAEVRAFEDRWLRWVKSGAKRRKDGTPIEPEALPAAGA